MLTILEFDSTYNKQVGDDLIRLLGVYYIGVIQMKNYENSML